MWGWIALVIGLAVLYGMLWWISPKAEDNPARP
jgi:hypothetical protein